MKKLITTLLFTFCFWGSVQAETKIAVVDPLSAISNTTQAQEMFDQLKAKLEKEQVKVVGLQKELMALQEKAERDGAIMSESEKRKLQQEMEDMQMEGQYVAQRANKRKQEGEQEILKAMGPKFKKAVKDVMNEKGFDMVLNGQAVIEATAATDITAAVTEKINAQK